MSTLNLVANNKGESPARETPRHEPRERRPTYHEIPGLKHETKDVLKQLMSNIQLLEDLNGRLGFMLSEVRSVIRR